jgi:hypothetical protein
MKTINAFLVIGLLGINAGANAEETAKADELLVYRSSSCTCCGKWVEHVQKQGFKVKDIVTDSLQLIKDKYGVTSELASCHTAIINGYVIEGHVPAEDITELLKTKSKVAGIAVPGMVNGSPGMEMGAKSDPYKVVSFDKKHNQQVFNSYPGK